MRKTFLIALLTSAFSLAACQQDIVRPVPNHPLVSKSFIPNFVLAKTNSELAVIQKSADTNLLRTSKDFDAIVATRESPLSKLSATNLSSFKSHLVFREGVGVVGLNYADIESELSYDEFAQVLALFGVDVKQGYWGLSRDPKIVRQLAEGGGVYPATGGSSIIDNPTSDDYEGYMCNARHNCTTMAKCICMSGCDK